MKKFHNLRARTEFMRTMSFLYVPIGQLRSANNNEHKIVIIFLSISLHIRFGRSKNCLIERVL